MNKLLSFAPIVDKIQIYRILLVFGGGESGFFAVFQCFAREFLRNGADLLGFRHARMLNVFPRKCVIDTVIDMSKKASRRRKEAKEEERIYKKRIE